VTASSVAIWQGLLATQAKQLSRAATSAAVKQALDYYAKKAPQVAKVDDLLKDRKLLQTVLTTYGLEGEVSNVGRLRQLLTQDPKDPKSLVNRLVDPRYTKLVADLSFANGTPAALKNPAYKDKLAQTYALNTYEMNLGNQDPALREAAYFLRNVGNVTSVYQLLGDKVLRDVVTKALQLPPQFATLDIDKQAAVLNKRLNLKDLQSALGKNAELYKQATDDQLNISNATDLANKASGVVKDLSDSLSSIEKLYQALAVRQDPAGANAAKIADQNGFVAQLTNVRGLLDASNSRTSDLVSSLDRLKQIAQQVPTVDSAGFNALKTEFDATVARLKTNIDGATYVDPTTGTPHNLLQEPGLTIPVTIGGTTFTFTGTDISSVKTFLDSAQAQFDSLSAGSTPPGSLLADLANARSDATTGLAAVAQQAQKYGNALNSVNSNVLPIQQQLLSRADSSATDAVQRAKQINSKLIALQSALESAQVASANKATLDATVQSLKADIEKLVRGNAGNTDNLLTGNGGYGSIQGLPLSIHGGNFLDDIVAKLKDVNAFSASGADAGAKLISETLRPLVATRINIIQADAAYVQSAGGSANFAITPDTAQLRLGSQSAADALDRATQIGVALGQLRALAQSAVKNGDGSTQLNVQASDLIQKISKLVDTGGTGLDNLLVGTGDQAYNFLPGAQLHIGNVDLGTKISDLLTGIDLSATGGTAAAQAAIDLINQQILPSLTDAKATLTANAKTIDTARKTFDPRAPIDDLFAATVKNITTQVAGATIGGKNLLTSAADQLLYIKSSPGTYTVSGHSEFDMQVTRNLQKAVQDLLANATLPTAIIHQSLLALNSIQVDLTGDVNLVKAGTRNVTSLLDDKKKAEAQQAAAPYQGTRLAKLLINQFLAYDAGDGSSNTYGATLAQMLGGQSNTTSILNLLI
jgi:Protein of unknown function (DUF1217)